MDIRLSKNNEGVFLLELSGNLNLCSSDQLKNYLMKKIQNGVDSLIISLEKVTAINSAGIGALVNIFSTLKKLNCSMVMIVSGGPVMEALEVTRLCNYFTIAGSLKEAVALASAAMETKPVQTEMPHLNQ